MITAVEIKDPTNVKSTQIYERIRVGKGGRNRDFLVLCDGVEVGLLIYEDWKKPGDLIYEKMGYTNGFIHEIFVLHEARRDGVGSWILSYAEKIAAGLGHKSVGLRAHSLAPDELSSEDLIAWYERKGYVRSASQEDRLEKAIALSLTERGSQGDDARN